MTVIDLLRKQLEWAHYTQEVTIDGVTDDILHFTETGTALPVGAAYAHSVIGEDIVVSEMLAHKKPLSVENTNTGLSEPMPPFSDWEKHETWVKTVRVDLPKLRAFAKDVYKATDDYLALLNEKDLEKEVDMGPMGKQTVLFVINNFVILHIANLTGEVSAAKGIQGLKGYPF